MPRPRVIVNRRQTVRNIHKITRTMQLIATSKFHRAFVRAVACEPYTARLTALLRHVTRTAGEPIEHPLLKQREPGTDLLVVLTSNRGLCGGYNASILRIAAEHGRAQSARGARLWLDVVGKKGINHLRSRGVPLGATYTQVADEATFRHVEEMTSRYFDLFIRRREINSVHVAYMKFFSAGTQRPTVARLLPVGETDSDEDSAGPARKSDAARGCEFFPGPEELVAELLPAVVKIRLFQFLNDASVSEQVARMTAMRSATENAEEMIRHLTQQYHRARQSQITREISEIIGGAGALE